MSSNTFTQFRRAGSPTRTRLLSLLAGIALAAVFAFGASRAHAQVGPQLVGSFPALSLTYTDAQGPGTATLTPQGPDPMSGGTAVAMRLAQGGILYSGGGHVRPGELGGYVLDVTIAGAFGDEYHLSGTLARDQDGARWRGRGRWWATWNRAITGDWQMAGGPVAQPAPPTQLSATVRLEPATKAAVRGTVTLLALREGETRFEAQLSGLQPGRSYSIQLHAGNVDLPSASFTNLATVGADAFGRARASGLVRFRGVEDIPLLEIADGNHIITVVGFGQTVAVGAIPVLQPLG